MFPEGSVVKQEKAIVAVPFSPAYGMYSRLWGTKIMGAVGLTEIWHWLAEKVSLLLKYLIKATQIYLLVLRAQEVGNEPFWNKKEVEKWNFFYFFNFF